MNDKLELLSMANDFTITKKEETYEISIGDLEANIEGEKISYYVTGTYDSGMSAHEIDIDDLKKLMKFCKLMIG
jgi:hypothetical protein